MLPKSSTEPHGFPQALCSLKLGLRWGLFRPVQRAAVPQQTRITGPRSLSEESQRILCAHLSRYLAVNPLRKRNRD